MLTFRRILLIGFAVVLVALAGGAVALSRIDLASTAAGYLSEEDARALVGTARLELDLLQILRMAVSGEFDPAHAAPAMKILLLRAAGSNDFAALENRLVSAQATTHAIFDKLLPP